MASNFHGEFEVSGNWMRSIGLVREDFENCWVIVGFNNELLVTMGLGVAVYRRAVTREDVFESLGHLIASDYLDDVSYEYEIWHMVLCPDYLMNMGCAYCKDDFVRHGDECMEFSTMEDAMDYVRAALGEWYVDFDVWRIASMVTAWCNGRLLLRDVDFWAICAANDLS